MPLTNTQYTSIMRLYDDIKTANRRMQSDRYNEVTALCPDIADIDSEIIDLSMKTARARIEADSSDTDTDELASSLKSLNERKVAALASIGKPADYLDDIFTCPYCKDSGYVDGKRCICFNKKAIDLIYKDSNLKNITADENFDTFSLSYYSDNHIDPKTGRSSLTNMKNAYLTCREFADTFADNFRNLFLYGDTGVGKTFLSNCIAKELIDHAYSVIYFTAFELFDTIAKSKFEKDNTAEIMYEHIFNCDLLIIDDLGTELSNAFTVSQLFLCLNERLLRRKSTIISTNLSLESLVEIYSERTFSRITSNYTMLKLTGDDIRIKKKLMNREAN